MSLWRLWLEKTCIHHFHITHNSLIIHFVDPANRSFSVTLSAALQIAWNKRKFLHVKRVQFPQDFFTQTWPPIHCFVHKYGRRNVMWKRSTVFNFSWGDCFTQEKLTTNQCTRGKQGVFWAVELNGFNHSVQFKNCLDTIQILQYGVLICKKNKTSLNISSARCSQISNHVFFHKVFANYTKK